MGLDNEIEKSFVIVSSSRISVRPQIYIMELIFLISNPHHRHFKHLRSTFISSTKTLHSFFDSRPNPPNPNPSAKMQFTSILTVLSIALAASATPINVERNETPGQQAQDKCGNNQTVKCCNTKKGITGILPITVGDCSNINSKAGIGSSKIVANCILSIVLSVLPLSSQCSGTQVVACCPNSGTQVN